MRVKLLLVLVLNLTLFSILASHNQVLGETVWFRFCSRISDSSGPFDDGSGNRYRCSGSKSQCIPINLNENAVSITQNNLTFGVGASCPNPVYVYSGGDWETAGSSVDTPPYSWGGTNVVKTSVNTPSLNMYFDCGTPTYTVAGPDGGALPSWLSFTQSYRQPHLTSSNDTAKLSEFDFVIDPAANVAPGTPLTLEFKRTANCAVDGNSGSNKPYNAPVSWASSNCNLWPTVAPPAFNPRSVTQQKTFYVGNLCATETPTPTPTTPVSYKPTLTPTPIPTNTPTPTHTPTPTLTPTPTITPTPTPPAVCNCEGLLEVINGTIGMGSTFTVRQHASTTSNAHVNSMVYHVERKVNNGTFEEIANSGEITAVATTDDPNLYYTDWTYTIPVESTSGTYEYHIWVDLSNRCEYNAHAYNRYDSVVLGTSTQKGSFFEMIRSFIASLFGSFRGTSKQNGETPFMGPAAPGGGGTMCITGANSPKLCTFYPALNIIKQCKHIYFTIFVP